MVLNTKDILEELGKQMVADIRAQLRKEDKVASGDLFRALDYEADEKELKIVAPGVLYEVIVDKGRTRGAKHPPLSSIRKWISDKNITARDVKQERLPYAIVNSIHNEGIDGIDFTNQTIQKFRPIINQSIGVEYQKELDRLMKEIKQIMNM
tara:strand:+ start:33 stop:488 length:456 start_codon:yes stop_codon:yes gene_type:complete